MHHPAGGGSVPPHPPVLPDAALGADDPAGPTAGGTPGERPGKGGNGNARPPNARAVVPLAVLAPPKHAAGKAEPPQFDIPRPRFSGRRRWFGSDNGAFSCLMSGLFHAALLVVLALIVVATRIGSDGGSLTATLASRADPASLVDDPDRSRRGVGADAGVRKA